MYAEEICAHFDSLFPGRESIVWHEIISDLVHIDVHVMKPGDADDFYVIYTTGMSDLPMTMPEELPESENWAFAELLMMLPSSWNPGEVLKLSPGPAIADGSLEPVSAKGAQPSSAMPTIEDGYSEPASAGSDEDYWAVNLIKFLARLPHEYKTWLGSGHTIPNGPDYDAFLKGSDMSCALIIDPGEGFSPLKAKDGTNINLYMVMPITKAETELKLVKGMDMLIDLFDKHNVPMVIDMFRKCTVS